MQDVGAALCQEVAELIGEPLLLALRRNFGGILLYVPKTIGHNHPISAAIGAPSAKKIAERFGGTTLALPKLAARRQRVLELRSRGDMTIQQIALATDYSERHVYDILNSAADDRQMTLFDECPKL